MPSLYAGTGRESVRIRRMAVEEFGTRSCVGTGGYCAGINEGTSNSMAIARKESVVEGCRPLRQGVSDPRQVPLTDTPGFTDCRRAITTDWREDLDLGRDAKKGLCASRGAYFKPGGGIGGLATNEKAIKARGCMRGRERDGPRSDWNIQQAEARKRRTSQVTI